MVWPFKPSTCCVSANALNGPWRLPNGKRPLSAVAFEIDGYPDRRDLKLSLLRFALEQGTRISLGTDAHHPWQLAFMEFALAAALLRDLNRTRLLISCRLMSCENGFPKFRSLIDPE